MYQVRVFPIRSATTILGDDTKPAVTLGMADILARQPWAKHGTAASCSADPD